MRQQARFAETRNSILRGAKICFSRSGYDAASVDDICKEAGITKGAFYYHFESKQSLFLELEKIWFSQFDEFLVKSREDELSVADSLVEMQKLVANAFRDPDNFLPMTLEFWMYSIRDPLVRVGVGEHYQHYIELLSHQLEEGRIEGSIETDDPLQSARAIIGLVMGLILLSALDPQGADWGKQIQDSVQLLINGMKPKK
jgi:AcrR family transcriptional regulator